MATPDFRTPNQEMPPPGGFKPVKFVKNGPATRDHRDGRSSSHNKHHREVAKEERENRIALLPFLQAEADVEYLEQEKHILEKERQVMKNVPGWVAGQSPYHSDRYQAPLWAQKK
ncbi:hypothetical protein AM588_10006316 [Phytophthora nicotianae]|uniref:NADH dehydrogenase [ubiquinone] 1 alpha subcomplex subunit 13 n=1 Tax=Phytophthora nicotianae TaxID=4792 RepID=A0A0W8DJZ5_PHYNI|nr:hypothetical protein AM588_10006316 [Phytophthora nicotianae]